jgi:hypothetical protein
MTPSALVHLRRVGLSGADSWNRRMISLSPAGICSASNPRDASQFLNSPMGGRSEGLWVCEGLKYYMEITLTTLETMKELFHGVNCVEHLESICPKAVGSAFGRKL